MTQRRNPFAPRSVEAAGWKLVFSKPLGRSPVSEPLLEGDRRVVG